MITGFGNNVISSLAADITAGQTTIQVMPGTGAKFAGLLSYDYANASNPLQTYAKITLTDAKETVFEICHLTSVNNDVLTVVRGQEGTTAKGWVLNDVIANFATRGSENQFVQIEQLQSGHYTSGVAGGTANALTLELPATFFVNGSTDWTLRTPIVVYPIQNNTGASTLQLTMGGRVLGTFKLYKGDKAELAANDIIKDTPLICLLEKSKSYFSVLNPGDVYLGSHYLRKDQNGNDIPDKPLFVENIGLKTTVDKANNSVNKDGDTMTGTLTLSESGITIHTRAGDSPNFSIINLNTGATAHIDLYDGKMRFFGDPWGGGTTRVATFDLSNGWLSIPGQLNAGAASYATNGDVMGSLWGGWLSGWLNSRFAERDNNINNRATWDWVNQNFVSNVRFGAVESALVQTIPFGGFNDQAGYVLTGLTQNDGDRVPDNVYRRTLQIFFPSRGWFVVGQ